jgi:hypothetical protein
MTDHNPRSVYASPAEAIQAPAEEFLHLACLHEGISDPAKPRLTGQLCSRLTAVKRWRRRR